MIQIYNEKENAVFFETKTNLTFDLKLRGRINIVRGNNGTGKTFLCKFIEDLRVLDEEGLSDSMVRNIEIIDIKTDNPIKIIKDCVNKLIIIDQANLLLEGQPNIVKLINGDFRNIYMIFARGALGFNVSPNYFAQLRKNNKKITLEYDYDIEGWY